MSEARGRSPWFWIGIGCGGIVLIAMLAIGSLAFVGWRTAKQFRAELEDPVARTVRAQKILGAESLPHGWHSVVNISLPLILDIVVLADRPVGDDGEPDEGAELFVYFKFPGGWDRDWSDYVSGNVSPAEWLRQRGVRIDEDEVLANGSLQVEEQEIAWVSSRGEFEGHGQESRGIITLLLIKCEGDRKGRGAIWTGADPAPGVSAAELELAGTNADPQRIAGLMTHFAVCG